MQTNNYYCSYPYTLTRANDLFKAPFGIDIDAPDATGLAEDAERIFTQMGGISKESLKAIIEVVQKVIVTRTVSIKRNSPGLSMLSLKHKLEHSLFIIPLEKTKRVFVMTRQVVFDSEGTQGFRIKNVIMLTFGANCRLVKTRDAIAVVVSLSALLDPGDRWYPFTERRLSVMQKLDHCPSFPKNYAYFLRRSKKSLEKVLVVQEKASFNLLAFHNEVKSLHELNEQNKRLICKELIAGLQEIDVQGLVHRDIKLENILVFIERPTLGPEIVHVKISDFGFACYKNDECALKDLLGSYSWASPELHQRAAGNSKAEPIGIGNDIWALGLVLYILCKGEPAPVQQCLFAIQKLRGNIQAAKTVLKYILSFHPTREEQELMDTSFASLKAFRPERVFSNNLLEQIQEIQADLATDKKLLKENEENWPLLVQSLPASPRTIKAIEHLALAMIQGSPRARMPLDEAYIEAESLSLERLSLR